MAPLKAALSLAGALGLQAGFPPLFLCIPGPGDADTSPSSILGKDQGMPTPPPGPFPGEDQGMPTPPPGWGRTRGCGFLPQGHP